MILFDLVAGSHFAAREGNSVEQFVFCTCPLYVGQGDAGPS